MAELVVVTGTDTGVGKTFVTRRLVQDLRLAGIDAIGLKPIETGWNEGESDALQLAQASNLPLDQVLWRHFALPAAPAVAAAAEGVTLDTEELRGWIRSHADSREVCLVEGAGGWLVPMTRDALFRDLVVSLRARVLIVGRAGLGTINHTLLTIESVARDLPIVGVALSVRPDDDTQFAHSNQVEIERFSQVPVVLVPGQEDRLKSLFHVERHGT